MTTMDVTGYYDDSNERLRFTVVVDGLQSDFSGSRQIVFELGSRGYYIEITTRSISGDGTYSFNTTQFTSGNTYIGRFKLQYKTASAETWTTALTESSDPIEVPNERPEDFSFPSSIRSGAATTTLTASKWRDFCDRINEFREYKGMSEYDFTYVRSGDEMTKEIMEEPWLAINAISGHGTMPTRPTRGATIYASFFHDLADALNEID